MDVTQDERDRGITFISDMTFPDYLKVIDAKIDELNTKAKKYMTSCDEDIRQWKNMTPHQVNVLIDMHKIFIDSMRDALQNLKDVAIKNLHKDYLVPSLLVQTFVDLSRKIASLAYIKLPNSHVRLG